MRLLRTTHLNYLADELVNLTVLEAQELVRILEKTYGMIDKNPYKEILLNVQIPQTKFDVVMTKSGIKKLQAVKLVKEITGLGLKESKDLVDNIPSVIIKGVSADLALHFKREFEEIGAVTEIV